jgi:hypothetical protein
LDPAKGKKGKWTPEEDTRQVTTMHNTNKPSTGYHQGEQLSLILLQSRIRLNSIAASGITDTELPSNHQGQCSKESRRLLLISILAQALELTDDVAYDVCEERDN